MRWYGIDDVPNWKFVKRNFCLCWSRFTRQPLFIALHRIVAMCCFLATWTGSNEKLIQNGFKVSFGDAETILECNSKTRIGLTLKMVVVAGYVRTHRNHTHINHIDWFEVRRNEEETVWALISSFKCVLHIVLHCVVVRLFEMKCVRRISGLFL